MHKIRMITTAAGPEGVLSADKEYVVDEKLARGLVQFGFAVDLGAVQPQKLPVEEQAIAEAPEDARRNPKRTKRTRR